MPAVLLTACGVLTPYRAKGWVELDPCDALTIEPGTQCRNPPGGLGYHMYPEVHFTCVVAVLLLFCDVAPFPVLLLGCAVAPAPLVGARYV